MLYYSLRDRKAELYIMPFSAKSTPDAMRQVAMACSKSDSVLSTYRADYDLYQLSDFDESSGLFTPPFPPKFICSLDSLITPEVPDAVA